MTPLKILIDSVLSANFDLGCQPQKQNSQLFYQQNKFIQE